VVKRPGPGGFGVFWAKIYHLDSLGCPGLPVPPSFLAKKPDKGPPSPSRGDSWGESPAATVVASRDSSFNENVSGLDKSVKIKIPYMNFFLGTANKPRKVLLDQLRILCRTPVRGVFSFYNAQIQAEGYLRYGRGILPQIRTKRATWWSKFVLKKGGHL